MKTHIITLLWCLCSFLGFGQSITEIEYFFNTDPGFGNATSVTANANSGDLTQSLSIPIGVSLTGFNKLYVRTKDNANVWSLYANATFYVTEFTTVTGAANIMAAEYFFNTDPGIGNATPIPIDANTGNLTQTISLPVGSTLVGFNSLYIRVKDDLGIWSFYHKRVFFVSEFESLIPSNIDGAEYFYDNDPGFGNGIATTITPTGNPDEYIIDLGTSTQTCDFHDFYIRLKNADGTWSLYDYGLGIEIYDNANPTIVVFPNITAELDATGQASITLADVDNGTFDDCDLVSVALNQTQFDYTCSDLGVNSVIITATDAEAKVSNQNVNITVVDLINPVAIAQNITVQLDSSGSASITGAQIDNGSTDNCSVTSFSLDVSSFDCNDLGANIVTLTAIDQSGNSSTNTPTATVTVEDNLNPTVVTKNITVQLDASGNASIVAVDVDNGSTDNCTINNRSLDIASFTCVNLGANLVTLTVTDQSGNSSNNTATVTVEDMIDPVAIGQDITIDLDGNPSVTISANDVNNGSSDNCGFSLSIDIDTFTTVGIYPVLLTATDNSGNMNSVTVMVTVEDSSLSLEDLKISAKNIKLFPIPTNGILHITTHFIIEEIIIYDLSGKKVKKIIDPNTSIYIGDLSTGIYFLNFKVENQTLIKRVIRN